MLICIFGESCTGKTTLARQLLSHIDAEVCSGRDYLRLAKSEAEAQSKFRARLKNAVGGSSLIYITAEKADLALLPEGCFRILMTAPLAVIQERFAKRMGGKLPPPVAAMLERKHGSFDSEPHELHVENGQADMDKLLGLLRR